MSGVCGLFKELHLREKTYMCGIGIVSQDDVMIGPQWNGTS